MDVTPVVIVVCFSGTPHSTSRQMLGDTIIFRSVQMGSSAVYQCNASNQHGYLLANAFVSVLGETSCVQSSGCVTCVSVGLAAGLAPHQQVEYVWRHECQDKYFHHQ